MTEPTDSLGDQRSAKGVSGCIALLDCFNFLEQKSINLLFPFLVRFVDCLHLGLYLLGLFWTARRRESFDEGVKFGGLLLGEDSELFGWPASPEPRSSLLFSVFHFVNLTIRIVSGVRQKGSAFVGWI